MYHYLESLLWCNRVFAWDGPLNTHNGDWHFLPDCNYEEWKLRWGGTDNPENREVSDEEWARVGFDLFDLKQANLYFGYNSKDEDYYPILTQDNRCQGHLPGAEIKKNLQWFFEQLGETEEDYWIRWDKIREDKHAEDMKDPEFREFWEKVQKILKSDS